MKNDSYDAKGIKFGFLTIPNFTDKIDTDELLAKCKDLKDIERVLNKQLKGILIADFNNFDGLTFEELFDFNVFNEEYIFFVVYSCINCYDYITNNVLNVEVLSRTDISNLDQTVDSYLADYLTDIYNNRPERMQQFIKAFLERYKYSSKENVDKVIKKSNSK